MEDRGEDSCWEGDMQVRRESSGSRRVEEGVRRGGEGSRSRESSGSRRVEECVRRSGETGETKTIEKRAQDHGERGSVIKRKRPIDETSGKAAKLARKSTGRNLDKLESYEDDIEIGDEDRGEVAKEKLSDRTEKVKGRENSRGKEVMNRKSDILVEEEEDEAAEEQDNNIKDTESPEEIATRVIVGGSGVQGGFDEEQHASLVDTRDTGKDVVDVERATVVGSGRSETSSATSSSSSADSSLQLSGGLEGGLRARALSILRRGAMPLCPPAKRDWNSNPGLDIEFNGQDLSWPPSNWKAMSPDQRLMAHEYVAIFLEKRKSEFQCLPRKLLLDKYSFLALDGEGRPQEEDEGEDKIEGKIRQYNFSYLKGIAKGEIKDSRSSWSILKSMERADRWTDTDLITEKLDSGGVKPRL